MVEILNLMRCDAEVIVGRLGFQDVEVTEVSTEGRVETDGSPYYYYWIAGSIAHCGRGDVAGGTLKRCVNREGGVPSL